jgi:hypothetical protein
VDEANHKSEHPAVAHVHNDGQSTLFAILKSHRLGGLISLLSRTISAIPFHSNATLRVLSIFFDVHLEILLWTHSILL